MTSRWNIALIALSVLLAACSSGGRGVTVPPKRAYTAIEWFFPQHGGKFDPKKYIDICTGDYVGAAGS